RLELVATPRFRSRALRSSSVLALICTALAACGQKNELLGRIRVESDSGAPDSAAPFAVALRFRTPELVSALSDPNAIDEDPTFTGDLLELYFMSTRVGTKDIWTSRRATPSAAWGAPAPVAELNSTANDWAPGISLDALSIWFVSERNGAGKIWHASRAARTD